MDSHFAEHLAASVGIHSAFAARPIVTLALADAICIQAERLLPNSTVFDRLPVITGDDHRSGWRPFQIPRYVPRQCVAGIYFLDVLEQASIVTDADVRC